ncbi:Family S53 protease [Mycena venus]|uniref:tripeptidyl-peptidase II n=1 Tax=Mycena venus TaxID=2733690 RepID=A0A8H7D2J2_9AGAR|nr:Family S53 protease [Mycena venus]
MVTAVGKAATVMARSSAHTLVAALAKHALGAKINWQVCTTQYYVTEIAASTMWILSHFMALVKPITWSALLSFGVLFFSLAAAAASSSRQPRVVHSSRSNAPQGFASLGPAPGDQTIKLRIALASKDAPGLEKALLDVSTPSSSNYGNHLTKDEVNAYLAPSDEALAAVQSWLSSNNVTASSSGPAGDWLTATVPISKANDLLGANYQTFQHINSGKSYARTLIIPISVRPVLSLPQSKKKGNSGSGSNADSCATTITPTCLQTLYGIPTTAASESSNSIAVAGFIEQFAQKADLQTFLTSFRKDMSSSTTFSTQTLDGGENTQSPQDAGVEALDIQYTVGVATGVPVVFVSVGEDDQDGDLGGFLDIVNFLGAEDNVPQVMTTSYGGDESNISQALAVKLCNAYMGLGARGTSVLFASGDGGVEGGQAQQCTTFQVAFPAGCPYLTAVGSVHGTSPETASDFSSGGFSNYFGVADYQADAVAGYLKALGSTNQGLFNASGRGYPDVSAQGENVQIVSGGQTGGVDGTSCSTPIFASVIGLINDQLVAGGKPPLGFLNPWLYSNAAALNDVSAGSNPGCGTDGFPAKAGWDPVTGLGTPNFAALKAAAGL